MSDAIPLPDRPDLAQYKKLARELQHACQSAGEGAIRAWAARWLETRGRGHQAKNMELRWNRLREHNPHAARCALAGAQLFLAREHGFASWPKFARHVEELARENSPVSAFEAAADAIIEGDAGRLRQLLAARPGLAQERSTREHRSTLLHYVSANGVEDFRQKTPQNIVEITNLLLDAGAEVDAESEAYGGGCTPLGLVATSVHPEKAGVQIALLRTLLDRGADLRHPSAAGNRHSVVSGCLANGQPAAARYLADLGAPLDEESAAGVGRLDVLQSYFDESGAMREGANRKRIESGFLYACGYGQMEAAKFLLERGIDPATRDDEGRTALHWAAWTPQPGVIRMLVERGAPVDVKDRALDATALDTLLWTWSNAREEARRERCYEAIALLARAGARLDREHWRNPAEERSAMLEKIDSDARLQAAFRGEG